MTTISVNLKQWILNPSPEEERAEWNEIPVYLIKDFTPDAAWQEIKDTIAEYARGFEEKGFMSHARLLLDAVALLASLEMIKEPA